MSDPASSSNFKITSHLTRTVESRLRASAKLSQFQHLVAELPELEADLVWVNSEIRLYKKLIALEQQKICAGEMLAVQEENVACLVAELDDYKAWLAKLEADIAYRKKLNAAFDKIPETLKQKTVWNADANKQEIQ
jgi:hypothetical protein